MTVAPNTPPLTFADIDEVLAALRANGNRITTPCRLVLEALFAAEGPVSAQFIADGQRQPGGSRCRRPSTATSSAWNSWGSSGTSTSATRRASTR